MVGVPAFCLVQFPIFNESTGIVYSLGLAWEDQPAARGWWSPRWVRPQSEMFLSLCMNLVKGDLLNNLLIQHRQDRSIGQCIIIIGIIIECCVDR